MDKIVIDAKSDSILRCIHRIKTRLPHKASLISSHKYSVADKRTIAQYTDIFNQCQ